VEVQLHAFLISALDEGEWLTSFPGRSTPKEPWHPLHRRLSGPQSRSGRGSEKNSQLLTGLEPLIIQPVAHRYTIELSQLPQSLTYSNYYSVSTSAILPKFKYFGVFSSPQLGQLWHEPSPLPNEYRSVSLGFKRPERDVLKLLLSALEFSNACGYTSSTPLTNSRECMMINARLILSLPLHQYLGIT
jgi:hypothetical protein